MKISDITNSNFMFLFKRMDLNNRPLVKSMFRELLANREYTFEKVQEKSFCSLCADILPEILAKKVRCKNAVDVVLSDVSEFKSFDILTASEPYLLRQQGGETVGMIRVSKREDIGNKEFNYTVFDCVPFISKEIAKTEFKFNDEKMQMFSVAYRSWEAWKQEDTDGEYILDEDLADMVKRHSESPLDLNLEHDGTTTLNKTDARIIELYQARTSWKEDDLSIRKGDLVATTQFSDTPNGRNLWDNMKSGEFTTYSIEGVPNQRWERE